MVEILSLAFFENRRIRRTLKHRKHPLRSPKMKVMGMSEVLTSPHTDILVTGFPGFLAGQWIAGWASRGHEGHLFLLVLAPMRHLARMRMDALCRQTLI